MEAADGGGSSEVTVVSTTHSLFGLRVLIALKEKGVAYEYVEEDLGNKSPLLLQSNPVYKKVPVLIHKGKPLCESVIILEYIDETWLHPRHALLPHQPYQRALVRFWADYVDKKVYEAFLLIIRNVEGESMERGRNLMKEAAMILDGVLCDVFNVGPYFGGEHINLLDIVVGSYIPSFLALETLGNFKVLDESTCPHLCAWVKVVVEYPSMKEGFATIPPQKFLEKVLWLRKTIFDLVE